MANKKGTKKKTGKKAGAGATAAGLTTNTFTSTGASSAYTTEIIHDVPAPDVPAIVADRMRRPDYRQHSIVPEDDSEFTLVFIYAA